MTGKKVLTFLLTCVWLLLIAGKYAHVFRAESIQGGSQLSFYLAEKLLRLSQAPVLSRGSAAEIYRETALDILISLGNRHPLHGRLDLECGMLLYELGRRDEAFRSFDRAGRDSRCSSLASVLKGIYGRRSSVRSDIAGYRKVIESQLSGWFRKRALLHLYEAAGQGKLAGEIIREEEEDGSRLMAGFSLVGLFILLLELSGLIFWLNFLLNPPGKREGGGPLNPALSLADAWLVFVSWEVLQIFLGRFFLPAFIRSNSVPMLFGAYLLNYGAALILLRAFSGGKISSFSASLGLRSLNIKSEALAGLGAYVGALPLVTAAALLSRLFFKGAVFSSNPVVPLIGGSGNALDRFLLFLLVACLAPVFEEILFRGLIYGVLRKKAGPVLSSLMVSLLFSLLHVDPVGLLPIFVLGILLAWLYEHTGSLIPSMVLHALWNCQVFFMAGFFLGS